MYSIVFRYLFQQVQCGAIEGGSRAARQLIFDRIISLGFTILLL